MTVLARGRGLYAKLTAQMIAEADLEAHRRRDYARANDKAGYNNPRVTHEQHLLLDILGARCEYAGWIFFPIMGWVRILAPDPSKIPDLDDGVTQIDVKGIPKDFLNLLVSQGTVHPTWAYLLISAEQHPYYWLIGWLWGEEVLRYPTRQMQADRPPAHFVKQKYLRKPYLLQQAVRERRNANKSSYAQQEHMPM